MATAVKEAREQFPNLSMFDAGDTLVGTDARRRGSVDQTGLQKAEMMADYLGVARPDAVSLGELDLIAGAARSTALLNSRGLTPIATNLRFADSSIKVDPFRAWESGGYRFVATNLFAPKASEPIEGVTVTEPLAALEAALASAGKIDILVVSCHRFEDALLKKLASMPGPPRIAIDVDGASRIRVASSVSQTIFVKPPSKGTDLLVADLYLKRGAPHWYRMDCYEECVRLGRPLDGEAAAAAECSLVDMKPRRLTAKVSGHPEVLKRIETYKSWARSMAATASAESHDSPKYVGAEACGKCHAEQLANWKSTLHAVAWKTLEEDPDGGAQDNECASCHVSGFLRPGGTWKLEDTVPFRGVQCESCHLPLASHPGGGKFQRPSEELCRTCHSESQDPEFDFAAYLKHATCTRPHDPAANRVPR